MYLFVSLFLIFSSSLFADHLLSKADISKTMKEILDYHIEHKSFSGVLAQRSIKLFIDQFDPEKSVLLEAEATPYIGLDIAQLDKIAQNVSKGDFVFFQKLNHTLHEAILRAREIRAEIYREFILTKNLAYTETGETFLQFAPTALGLEDRIKRRALRFLFSEAKLSQLSSLTPALKEKIFELLEKKLRRLEEKYVFLDGQGKRFSSDMKEHGLALHFLKAFAKSLDAHTCYFSPEEAQELRATLEKQFEGIGVVLREGVLGIEITDMIKDSPAERSLKLKKGDLLAEVNGVKTNTMSYEQVLSSMKGEHGSKISLSVIRPSAGPQLITVQLIRERILLSNSRITWSYEPLANGILGKIVLSSFYESHDGGSCEQDLRKAVRELKAKGDLIGLVLDLRNNSGGFLTQAVKVAGLFIKTGVVVVSKYSQGKTSYLRDLDGRMLYDGPLLVLTSKASASAAEIVAQALQDYGTALIVGDERTYGKGSIQYQNVTDKQASSYFKVTVGKYYTVSGKSTQIEGVKADIWVPTAYYSLNIGERFLEHALTADQIPSLYIDPLLDIDEARKHWFQKNYIPHLQVKENRWISKLSLLAANSGERIKASKDYQLFLKLYDRQTRKKSDPASKGLVSYGEEDLPLGESVNILKDMVYLQDSKPL